MIRDESGNDPHRTAALARLGPMVIVRLPGLALLLGNGRQTARTYEGPREVDFPLLQQRSEARCSRLRGPVSGTPGLTSHTRPIGCRDLHGR